MNYPLYLILGPGNSERNAILADFCDIEAPAEAVLLTISPETVDSLTLPEDASSVFLVGEGDLIDLIEALAKWLSDHERELTRVITIFPLPLLHEHKEIIAWLEAAVFFSDVLLLTQTGSLKKNVVRQAIEIFSTQRCYPCYIEEVSPIGKCRNPALILDSEIRRMSHYFEGEELIAECDENEDLTAFSSVFPLKNPDRDYFTRLADGRRLYRLPKLDNFKSVQKL
jgi:hypothetical protein